MNEKEVISIMAISSTPSLINLAVYASVGIFAGIATKYAMNAISRMYRDSRPTVSVLENVTTRNSITNSATDPNTPSSVVADVQAMMRR